MHTTFTDFMTGDMQYSKMTETQIQQMLKVVDMKYQQSSNEMSLYRDPVTGHVVAKWVDDIITRGSRAATDKFWKNMESPALMRWLKAVWTILKFFKTMIFTSSR